MRPLRDLTSIIRKDPLSKQRSHTPPPNLTYSEVLELRRERGFQIARIACENDVRAAGILCVRIAVKLVFFQAEEWESMTTLGIAELDVLVETEWEEE